LVETLIKKVVYGRRERAKKGDQKSEQFFRDCREKGIRMNSKLTKKEKYEQGGGQTGED